MEIFVSSRNARDFEKLLQKCSELGFSGIELDHKDINERNLNLLSKYKSKVRVIGIAAKYKDFKYQLFVAESLNCEYISLPLNNPNDLQKIRIIADSAKNLGIIVAIENNKSSELYNTEKELLSILERLNMENVKLLINTADAKVFNASLMDFNKIKNKIMAFHLSDIYGRTTGLPYGLGKYEYINPIIMGFKKEKTPWIIRLDEKYDLMDAFLSKENFVKYVKSVGEINKILPHY